MLSRGTPDVATRYALGMEFIGPLIVGLLFGDSAIIGKIPVKDNK